MILAKTFMPAREGSAHLLRSLDKGHRTMRKFLFSHGVVWVGLTLGLAVIIGWLTLTTSAPTAPDGPPGIDKLYHGIAFAALVLPSATLARTRVAWGAACLVVLYGGGIEIVQSMVGRNAELADFVADIAGVAIGLLLGRTLRCSLLRPPG